MFKFVLFAKCLKKLFTFRHVQSTKCQYDHYKKLSIWRTKNAEYYANSKFVYMGSKRFQTSITAKKIKAK